MVDDGGMDDGPWLYYKLTNEPKGSGELKKKSQLGSFSFMFLSLLFFLKIKFLAKTVNRQVAQIHYN